MYAVVMGKDSFDFVIKIQPNYALFIVLKNLTFMHMFKFNV